MRLETSSRSGHPNMRRFTTNVISGPDGSCWESDGRPTKTLVTKPKDSRGSLLLENLLCMGYVCLQNSTDGCSDVTRVE